ncbi:MAG: two-component sensor histidine kinase [Rubrivivax sp. SCN 70-15]|nr:MAG: two-component sensor histidine kinase [Rubrivivax sp. SCN 70-15]
MRIRDKLLAMVLLPLVVVLPLLGVVLLWWGNVAFDRLLVTKVRADLAVAQGYFERVQGSVGASVGAIADSHALHLALADPHADLVALLQRLKAKDRLDFINLRSADGTLVFTDSGPARGNDRGSPAFAAATEGDGRTGLELLQPDQQGLLGADARARIDVPLLATRNAAPTARRQEDRAMLLLSTHAVHTAGGRLVGYVQGGVLLNRNLAFIDHINQIVYPEGSLPFGSRGTATLFLGDVRISTNVRLFGSEQEQRAIGTRVSQSVRDAVLGRGSTWLERAFVVDQWYVSAYEPLADSTGRRIGMLYVGFLERPFQLLKYAALASIGAIFFAVMAVAAVVSLRWARTIFGPLERMEATMRRVEDGALDARVGTVASGDEIGRLAGHLDHLLETIARNTQALRRWNAELDAKVAERSAQLESAQAQLVRSEKLATVGQLTASIAHEVNNPIAVIQGNVDLLRELLPREVAASVAPELKLVDEQIQRMRLIVNQLLQFARPTEFAGYVESLAPAQVIEDCLVLVGHLLAQTRIVVRRELQAERRVEINRQELQQVIVNLIVNAIAAMAEGGTLTLATRDAADVVEIVVADTGPGLPADLLPRLFQPFVTGKKDGNGLGLWISRGIVERYGGTVTAANRDGGGAQFTVRLKADAA